MSMPIHGHSPDTSKVIYDKFHYGDRDNFKVYAVAVPSVDFLVKSVRVFRQKENAALYMNSLYQAGEQPEMFETVVE